MPCRWALRLLAFAALEFLTMLRVAVTTVLSLLGIGGLDRAFAQVRLGADNQRGWASRTGDRVISARYEAAPSVEPGGLATRMTALDMQGAVEVCDDGLGGAEGQVRADGGITGIRRRLEPFDGALEIVSPVGGGTFATIRVPRPAG